MKDLPINNIENKAQTICELYSDVENREDYSITDYVKDEAENDPDYFDFLGFYEEEVEEFSRTEIDSIINEFSDFCQNIWNREYA